ncbi:VCBS domain-containing protein, partial [Halopseudomonas sp.]|uniref:VCBS domain-containing protein n=1 Tax=Halopseudomonas sp. TaxID=2901191 RepID=UPI0035659A15
GTIAGYTLGTSVTQGSLSFNGDGSYSFDPGTDFDDLAVGASRDVSFTYTATDNDGGVSAEQTVTITVTGTNDVPEMIGGPANATLSETNVGLSTSGSFTVADSDAGDIVTASISNFAVGGTSDRTDPAAPSDADLQAMLTVSPNTVLDGSINSALLNWSFDSASQAFNYLAAGETLQLAYTVTIQDSQGATATDIINITIIGTNDAPTISSLPDNILITSSTNTIPLNFIVIADVDSGETVTASLRLSNPQVGLLSATGGAVYDQSSGVWSITGTVAEVNNALASLSFTPIPGSVQDSTLVINIDDGDEDGSGPLLGELTLTTNLPTELPIDLVGGGPGQGGQDTSDPSTEPDTSPSEQEVTSGPLVTNLPDEPSETEVRPGDDNISSEYVSPFDGQDPSSDSLASPTLKASLNDASASTGNSEKAVQLLRDQITKLNEPFQLLDRGNFASQLDNMRKELVEERSQVEQLIGTSLSVSAGLSVGYVVWLARSGIIMSSVLSSLPAWRFIDPLPVLGSLGSTDEEEDSESLESMVTEANQSKSSSSDQNEST